MFTICSGSRLPPLSHSTYIFRRTEAGKVAAAAGAITGLSRPLHFPCKSASHSQSFHSSSRNHAPSQPHSLATAETIARQLSPPTTMAGGRTSSRGFADSCKMPQTPSHHPGVKLSDSSPHGKCESGGHDCRVRPPCTQVFKSRNSCSCPCLRQIE